MPRSPIDSYLICSTPRTGSTLLCSLLKATRVAGIPESYFRREDLSRWAEKWEISRQDGTFEFNDYVGATLRAGKSKNGIFAARIMWGTMDELTQKLRAASGALVNDVELVEQAFGRTKFLHIKRDELVAQAVSRLIAEQTQIWHQLEGVSAVPRKNKPEYDFDALNLYVEEARVHQQAWEEWFARNDIIPHKISYAQLDEDPEAVILGILKFLGIDMLEMAPIQAPNKRLADEINEQWIARYYADSESA